jgi:hypothetical protein
MHYQHSSFLISLHWHVHVHTESIAFSLVHWFRTNKVHHRPKATDHIGNRGQGRSPPNNRVTQKVDILVGFLATIVVQPSIQKRPGPRTGFITFLLGMSIVDIIAMNWGTEIMVGPPHDSVKFNELLKKIQRLV